MDRLDREIVNAIQSDFPITSRPFLDLANKLGFTEDVILSRIRILKERGIIRRIGGNFQSRKLNFTSTLCAAKVPEEKLNTFVETVNRYSGVTHNYLRDHEYNVWFTFIAPDMKSIDLALKEISEATGVADILNLPAVRMFKIKVDFEV
ncbi:MAG: Lrp/AsnC family transcriptional regulator [Deltaproteobacteria bacterium HGW-Deltaproteobacteria-15]|jgi:DNA-binding Lrp family transcriptional regulator|nr:MAG: Lrp/AsnC family transcriptional regulator [Deltaproteobacteria bacterium HGW-Deltaproteobacteria-15]